MSQRQQLERLLEIDQQIRGGHYPTAERIAAKLEVSKRVIYKDKSFMVERLGAPIAFSRERGGWYYTDKTWVLPGIYATEGELLAFFLSVDVTQRYLGTAFEAPLRVAVGKLTASLNDRLQVSLSELSEVYTIAAPDRLSVDSDLLMALQRAIQEQKPLRISYYTASRGEVTERTVHPHHLYNMRGDWYLIAYDRLRQEMRNFHTGRIRKWQLLKERFERVPGFSVTEHMQSAFQKEQGGEPQAVAIRFGPVSARYIRERRWHASQKPLEDQPDGGVILRMAVSGLGEVKRWVLQYGPDAEVLEPAGLRQAILDDMRAAVHVYEAAGPSLPSA